MKPIRVSIYFYGNFPDGGATATRIKGYVSNFPEEIRPTLRSIWPSREKNPASVNPKNIKSESWQHIPFQYLNNKEYRPKSLIGKFLDTLISWKNMIIDVISRRKEIDLIYIYNPELHYVFPIVMLAKLLRIPAIAEQTELQSEIFNQVGMNQKIFYWLKRGSEQHLKYWFKHLVVISNRLESFYADKFPANLSVIRAFADEKRFLETYTLPEPFTIGYLGSFGLKDGIPGMLEGIAAFKGQCPNISIRLIGDFSAYPALWKQLNLNGLTNNVELTGLVDDAEIPGLLGGCHVLICNRNNSAYAAYGFPSKLVEYTASGIPVIASNVGDAKFIYGNTIKWIAPEQPNELSAALSDIYSQYGAHQQQALKAKQIFRERLTAKSGAQLLANLFKEYAG